MLFILLRLVRVSHSKFDYKGMTPVYFNCFDLH